VGADRGLKRLSLARVAELPLQQPVIGRVGESKADVRRRVESPDAVGYGFALAVDDHDRPLGWMDRHDLSGDGTVDADMAIPGAPTVQPESTLRDALSAMLSSSVQLGVVVDERERVLGVISVDAISDALRTAPETHEPEPRPA
jgi:osmoprotectant transport system ATP-binding protein